MGTSHLYGGYILNWFSSELSAKLYGTWPGEGKSAFGMLKKNCAVDSAYIYFAVLLGRQGICCLFSRADILAATVTTITFLTRFDKILEVGVQVKKGD